MFEEKSIMSEKLCLDKNYSTTRLITEERPVVAINEEDALDSFLFLPTNTKREGEGGLRTKGYFKQSYQKQPLITVVTVVYNGEEYLEQTIQSVIHQSYDNVEYIIVDGASSDGTLDIIKKYEEQIDYWVSERDGGIYDAMNKGISLATGEFVNFMNTGDSFYSTDIIKDIFSQADYGNCVVVYGNVMNIYYATHKVIFSSKPLESIYKGLPFSHQASFTQSKYLRKLGFDLQYRICADYNLFYNLYIQKLSFIYVNITVANYDMFGTSTKYSKSFLEKKIISNIYEPSKNKYFSTKKYFILKLKDYIKSYLSDKQIKRVKIWLSESIYHRKQSIHEE